MNDSVAQAAGALALLKQRGKPFTAIVIGLCAAAAAGLLTHWLKGQFAPWLLLGLGVLAGMGLLGLLGAVAGLVHLGSMPRQRAFFDGLADAIDEAFAVTDSRGRVVYANHPYRALVSQAGLGRMVGVENLYAGHPDISDAIYRLAQAARDRQHISEEFRLAAGSAAAGAKADEPAWIRVSITPIAASLGQVFVLWRLADVSQDRQRQESAFSRLQYIINYLDSAPAGFFSSDADGRVAYINATLSSWLGLDLEQTMDGRLTLEDIATIDGKQLLLGVSPRAGKERTDTVDIEMKTRDGRLLPVRIIHRTDFDSQGKPQPSRSLVLRRNAGEQFDAHESELQLSRLFNTAPIAIAQIDRSGRVTNANAAFLKLSPLAKRGAPLADLAAEPFRGNLSDALRQALRRNSQIPPVDIALAGDQTRTVQIFFAAASLDSGEYVQTIVYAVETTEHRALEVQLAQSQKMQAIGQLAGGVAHDFNNVLTAIIGFSDLLLARHRPTDPAFADIMNIKQNANRAANLVRQLLAFSRRQTLRPEVLSLTDAISDLGNLLGRLLGEKVGLRVVHGRDVGLVKIDVNQFEQVIVNLAVNARDAMPNGGTLTVRTANVTVEESRKINPDQMPPGEYVLCELEDTGTGMPAEILEKIYEPFFSTKEVGKGTGLGLSTVYGIVKQTGGFIFCQSELGKGTTFRIYLPRHYREPAKEEGETRLDKQVKKQDLTGKGTVLLVEDEDAVRAFASRALASRGYKVLEADSGEMALRLFGENHDTIDLVLSDVVMPEMDGPTLLKELRKRGAKTKIVFISGYAEDAFEKNLEGQTDFAFLPKPFTLKQLAEAVKQAMES
ncbi:MAG TPA: PAS domain-containing protein [Aestuariivirgaceae bacterium]|jgi:two-component system cell cycle sensor histidine kinase/response regulator CckA